MKIIKAFIICFLCLAPLRADFDDIGAGARPLGMGNAFVALADDARAVVYNPAGLALLQNGEFTADYGRLFGGLNDNSNISSGFVALAQPLSRRKSLEDRISDLRRITDQEYASTPSTDTALAPKPEIHKPITFFRNLGTVALSLSNLTLSDAVSENMVRLAYGRKLLRQLCGGLALKFLYLSYAQDKYTRTDPVFNYGNRGDLFKFSFDASLLYNIYPRLFWGLTLTNLNRPNVALNPSDSELLPMGVKSGFAYRENKIRSSIEVQYLDKQYRINAGTERWFRNKTYAVRFGGGFGSSNYKNVATGMSANWGRVQLDYAFLYPITGVTQTYGNHKFSVTYRFGKAGIDTVEPGSIELYYSHLQTESELLRARLEKAEDERSRLEKVLVEEALSRIKEKVRTDKIESDSKLDRKAQKENVVHLLTGEKTTPSSIKTYVTAKKDTLETIAELFYGKKGKWIDIYNLNKDKISRGGKLKSGTVLLIPNVKSKDAEEPLTISPNSLITPLEPLQKETAEKTGNTEAPALGTVLAPQIKNPAPKKKKEVLPELEKPKTYTVQTGDTLSSIAQQVLGDAKRWKDLYSVNSDKVDRGSVAPGTVLKIP